MAFVANSLLRNVSGYVVTHQHCKQEITQTFSFRSIWSSSRVSHRKFCCPVSIVQFFPASSHLLTARVQKAAPDFKGTAVINNDFKEIKLSDYKGKYLVSSLNQLTGYICMYLVPLTDNTNFSLLLLNFPPLGFVFLPTGLHIRLSHRNYRILRPHQGV